MRALLALALFTPLLALSAFAQAGQSAPSGAFEEPGPTGEMELESGLGDIEIEEEAEAKRGSAYEAFRKYVFATVGGSYVIGTGSDSSSSEPEAMEGDNSRVVLTGSIGVDYQSDFFQFYAQGTVWDQEIEITQEIEYNRPGITLCRNVPLDDPRRQDCTPSTRTIKIEDDDAEFSEGYLSLTPLSWIRLRVGRRKVVWGQFDVFSPVDLLLPFRTQSTDPYFTKVNFRRPQDHAQLSITPHERIELQGYWFYNTRVDPLILQYTRQEYEVCDPDDNLPPDMCHPDYDSRATDRIEDHNQFAARLLFYPNWGTLAFTWYRGRHSLGVNDFTRIDPPGGGELTRDAFTQAVMEQAAPGSIAEFPTRSEVNLADLDAYAVEFSARRGRWLFRTELVYRDSTGDLDELRSVRSFRNRDPVRENYLDWIVNENGGRFYGDLRTIMGGIGFKYESEKWLVDVAALALMEDFTGSAKRGAELNEAAVGDDPAAGVLAAPFINIARYFGRDKTVTLGFTAGFIGAYGAGASLYTVFNFDQLDRFGVGAFQLVLGLDAFQYNTDSTLSDLNDMGDLYELDEDLIVGPRVGIVWKF